MANEKSIGALWIKTSKNGNKYMSGEVEINGQKHKITVFKNNYKEKETHPDYKIMPQTEMGSSPKQYPQTKKPEPPQQQDAFGDDDFPVGMIPF